MFKASHPFAFFDYFRIPYDVASSGALHDQFQTLAPLGRLHARGQAEDPVRSLFWLRPDMSRGSQEKTFLLGRYQLGDFTLFARTALNAAVPGMLHGLGHGWRPAEAVTGADDQPVAAVWRDDDGNVFLPFDPGEVMHYFWSEKYRGIGRSAMSATVRTVSLRSYYLARPLLPRALQLRLRRVFTRVQGKSSFPGWPIEDNLHNFYTWLFTLVSDLAGSPVPFLDLWPDGRSWALVLTHDVETDIGYRDMRLLRDLERDRGYKSSWNFVPLRYRVGDDVVRALKDEGCEVGVHGLRHDGRDLGSRRMMERRLPEMRDYAKRWNAVGFRSPGTQRQWELMPMLGFDYDSSYTDTDPYEPQPGGCCTYLPYFNQEMVELPITMAQDHTLSRFFRILKPARGCRRRISSANGAVWYSYSRIRITRMTGGSSMATDVSSMSLREMTLSGMRCPGMSRHGGAIALSQGSATVRAAGGLWDLRQRKGECGSQRPS